MAVAGVVEGGADGGDLPIHHAARGDHVCAGLGLGNGDSPVEVERGVVVHLAGFVDHATVAVIGVFVDTQIGHDHHVVTYGITKIAECHLDDPGGIPCLRPLCVLGGGHPEQDHARDSEVAQRHHLVDQRCPGVLDHPGERRDGMRRLDALANEQRRDEVVGRDRCFGDQPPEGRCAAQAAKTSGGKAHAGSLRVAHRVTISRPGRRGLDVLNGLRDGR